MCFRIAIIEKLKISRVKTILLVLFDLYKFATKSYSGSHTKKQKKRKKKKKKRILYIYTTNTDLNECLTILNSSSSSFLFFYYFVVIVVCLTNSNSKNNNKKREKSFGLLVESSAVVFLINLKCKLDVKVAQNKIAVTFFHHFFLIMGMFIL